jgi:hypothetical protein
MIRSPDNLIPLSREQSMDEKRDDKALKRQEGEANSKAVNATE